MNAFPVPFKIVATVMVTCLLVTIGILNLHDRASFAEPSDGIFWVESENGLIAQEVMQEGPGSRAGIREGDLLVSINGRTIANLGQYVDLLYSLGINASASYVISKNTEKR